MLRAVMLNSCLFIAGFSVVFISLGAVATTVGQLTREFHRELAMIAGAVIIIFGLHLTGLLKIKALYADKRLHSMKAAGPLRAFLVGFAFAFGWTPCIGPILAGILVLAGSQDTVAKGILAAGRVFDGAGCPIFAHLDRGEPFSRILFALPQASTYSGGR